MSQTIRMYNLEGQMQEVPAEFEAHALQRGFIPARDEAPADAEGTDEAKAAKKAK